MKLTRRQEKQLGMVALLVSIFLFGRTGGAILGEHPDPTGRIVGNPGWVVLAYLAAAVAAFFLSIRFFAK